MKQSTKTCVVIPTYNNAGTLLDVIGRVCRFCRDIIVVDDGSTDGTSQLLADCSFPVYVVTHAVNQGKGMALKTGFATALSRGFTHAVTIDSDGQHFPEDLPVLLKALEANPRAIVVGCRNLNADRMPRQNTFANRFSNFWFRLQTGCRLEDTQSGYRVYPLDSLYGLPLLTARYEAELELLVMAAWHGVKIVPASVRVFYAPEGERVSHFRPFWDFFRISVLNTVLCFGALFYGLPLRIARWWKGEKA